MSNLPGQGPVSIHPHLLGPPFCWMGERVRVPLTLAKLPSTACLSGTEGYDSTTLFHSLRLPDTPQPFPFLFRMKQTRTNSFIQLSNSKTHTEAIMSCRIGQVSLPTAAGEVEEHNLKKRRGSALHYLTGPNHHRLSTEKP